MDGGRGGYLWVCGEREWEVWLGKLGRQKETIGSLWRKDALASYKTRGHWGGKGKVLSWICLTLAISVFTVLLAGPGSLEHWSVGRRRCKALRSAGAL